MLKLKIKYKNAKVKKTLLVSKNTLISYKEDKLFKQIERGLLEVKNINKGVTKGITIKEMLIDN